MEGGIEEDFQVSTSGVFVHMKHAYTHTYILHTGNRKEKGVNYVLIVEREEDRNEFRFSHIDEFVLRLELCQHQGIPPLKNQHGTVLSSHISKV